MSYIKNLVTSAWHLICSSSSSSQCLTSYETSPAQRLAITSETKKTFDLLSHKSMSRRCRVENWNIEPDSTTLEYFLHNTPIPTKTTSAGRKRKRTHLLTPDSSDFKRRYRKKNNKRRMADIEMMDVDVEAGYEVVEDIHRVLSAGSDEEGEQEEDGIMQSGDEGGEADDESDDKSDDEGDDDDENDEDFESESDDEPVTDPDDSSSPCSEDNIELGDESMHEEVSDKEAGIDEELEDVGGSEDGEEMEGDEEAAEASDGGEEVEADEEEVEGYEEGEEENEEKIDVEEDDDVAGVESDYGLLEAEAEDNNTAYESAEEDISSLVAELEDANLDTIVHRTREVYSPGKLAARDTERIGRLAEVADLAHAGWTGHDLTLYRAIHLRGLEPLMPRDWAQDILALPYELFTSNEEAAFIRNWKGSSGSVSMLRLMTMGGYIRGLFDSENLERRFRMMIKEFENWTLTDIRGMKLRRWKDKKVLTLAVITAPKFADNDTLMRKAIRKLEKMEAKWKGILEGTGRDVPPLYAIIHSGFVSAVMAYVPDHARHQGLDEHTKMKTIAFITTWNQREYDVWNAFALAIVIVHSRNVLMETVKGFDFHNEEESGDDL